jgi:CHAD domain-containing protein
VREADVVRALLRSEARRYGWLPAAVARVDAVCAADRDAALARMHEELKGLEPHALAGRLRGVAASLGGRDVGPHAARAVATEIRRRTRRLIDALDRAGTVYGTDSLHQVRLAAKKLRYTLEIGLANAEVAAGARSLKRVQQRLGDIHDLQTLQRKIRGVPLAPDADAVLAGALDTMDRDLEFECRQRHAVVLRSRKTLDRRLAHIARTSASDLLPERAGRAVRMPCGDLRRKAAG